MRNEHFECTVKCLSALTRDALSTQIVARAPSNLLKLRGGVDLGPINDDNVNGFLKLAAACTAAGAITQKYADLEATTITKFFSGDVWTSNLIIALVTGVASTVVYNVGASGFEAGKLTSALWAATVLLNLQSSNFDVAGLFADREKLTEFVIAVVTSVLAWA